MFEKGAGSFGGVARTLVPCLCGIPFLRLRWTRAINQSTVSFRSRGTHGKGGPSAVIFNPVGDGQKTETNVTGTPR